MTALSPLLIQRLHQTLRTLEGSKGIIHLISLQDEAKWKDQLSCFTPDLPFIIFHHLIHSGSRLRISRDAG